MDSIFGIGPLELALILIIAGVVMGPERMVRTARWLGQAVAQMQAISQNLRSQLENEVDGLDDNGQLRDTLAEMRTLQREVSELRQQVQNTAVTTLTGTANKPQPSSPPEPENSIRPPQAETPPPPQANGTTPTPNGHTADLPQLLDVPEDPE